MRMIRTGIIGLIGAGLLLAAMLGWNLWTYQQLTAEQWVADLSFNRIGDGYYMATLEPSGKSTNQFELRGDDWQLDVRLVTWTPWMQLLGNDPIYRLDRISGRYRDVETARTRLPSIHALSRNPGLDLWALARDGGNWMPGVDAAYGSAVFLPMADGARYRISLSARGLLARPSNEYAASAISAWY